MDHQLFIQLKQSIKGELYWDKLHKGLYATDASLYQVLPKVIAIPKDVSDLQKIVAFCNENKIPITSRGAATSLAGQTVGEGLIIDFSKYFSQIIEINPKEQYAIVQCGVYRDTLNKAAKKYNLHFAPDPATSSRATFGGMIGNNSSGTRSILYGKAIDHIISLDVMLTNGQVITIQDTDIDRLGDSENDILIKKIRPLIFDNADLIRKIYPKVMRRVSGYALDEFVDTTTWNLSKLICGSEGTLAFILSAKVKMTALPEVNSLSVLHFKDRHGAIAAVPGINLLGPASVELLDYNVLEASKDNAGTKKCHDNIITKDPAAVLFVEFFGETIEQLELKNRILETEIQTNKSFYHNLFITELESINDALKLRKDGLGLIMNQISAKKPLAFIEDSAIPLEHLSAYVSKIEAFCNSLDVNIVLYAHASVGVLHIRPYLDLHQEEDVEKLQLISNYAYSLVKEYKGSWSGEHGDGRVRSQNLKDYYGDKIYDSWKKIKAIFDPQNLLNPGVIIDAAEITTNLKIHPKIKRLPFRTYFKYKNEGSFDELVNQCTGVGACVKHNVGTMCPSYMATKDEKDSTRGRANILRLSLNGKLGNKGVTNKEVTDALSLCLSCKACKTECPSNVDVAKLKSEYLQKKYEKKGISLFEWSITKSEHLAKLFSGKPAYFINKLQSSSHYRKVLEKVFKIDKRRVLPSYSTYTLQDWYIKNYTNIEGKDVALFCDTYINFHDPEIGKSSIKLLNEAGYNVLLANVGCCQRPKISNGFLKDAREEGTETLENLSYFFDKSIPVLVCEPSCTSALIDDLPDLIKDEELSKKAKEFVFPIDKFIMTQINNGTINRRLKFIADEVLVQNHCHANALWKDSIDQSSIKAKSVSCPDLGCCGMAGAFGYEKSKYDVSQKIYEGRMASAIDNTSIDTAIVSNGFSCRHQIKDFSNKKAIHWVEAVEWE
jgi:FAD/FMN-containing dehydrogenase/Fe-S oxidoreductase